MIVRFVLFLVIIAFQARAQESITDVSLPTSPASSVLGLQASEILTPKSFKALETALYSNFVDGNNNAIIPNDFALEFTPYWAENHGLSLEEFLFPTRFADQLFRNSSFSIASTQNLVLGDSTASNGLGFGYRTTFYFSSKSDKTAIEDYWSQLTEFQTVSSRIGAEIEGLVANGAIKSEEEFVEQIRTLLTAEIEDVYGVDNTEASGYVDEIISDLRKSTVKFESNNTDAYLDNFYNLLGTALHGEEVFRQFEDYIKERNGLSIDVAAAMFVNFPTNDFEFSYAPRKSVWITPAYRFRDKLEFLKVMLVLRKDWYDLEYYRKYFAGVTYFKDNTDYGIGVSCNFKKFSIQAEGVGRSSYTEIEAGEDGEGNKLYRKETKSAFQYIANFNYKITSKVALSYSLGNKFNLGTEGNSLISVLSLNLGFGEPDVLKKDD